MKKAAWVVVAMGLSTACSAGSEPGLCQRLAGTAEQIPVADWIAAIYDPMDELVDGPGLRRSQHKLSPVEEQLVNDPGLHRDLSVGPEQALGVERLEGTDIYRVDSFQGTQTAST